MRASDIGPKVIRPNKSLRDAKQLRSNQKTEGFCTNHPSIIMSYRLKNCSNHKKGGKQLRFPDSQFPDILHSYFSVCGLCLCGLLPPLDAMLGMSQASRQAAEERGVLPPWKVKEKDAGQDEKGRNEKKGFYVHKSIEGTGAIR